MVTIFREKKPAAYHGMWYAAGFSVYRIWHRRMGMRQAGTRFMTLIFVTPSMFKDNAAMRREPTQVISFCTAALPIRGDNTPASREMEPW